MWLDGHSRVGSIERLEPSLNPPRHFRDPFKLLAASITSRQVDFSLRSAGTSQRSEEHTSELQSLRHLVCRLLLEKKKKNDNKYCIHLRDQRHVQVTIQIPT